MWRLFNIATVAFMTCGSVHAAFTHPFVSQGQVYTNTMMLDLVYARNERWWPSKGTNLYVVAAVAADFSVYAGSTNAVTVVTNGAYVITNSLAYPQYSTTRRYNDECFLPWSEFGYTNVPHVLKVMFAGGGGPGGRGVDDYSYYDPPWDDDTDSGLYWTRYYAPFWYEDGVNFTNYLGQLGNSTNYPLTLPRIYDPAEIMVYTNIGYVTNSIADEFGIMGGIGGRVADWYFTRSPPTTQNWNLAETYVGVTNVAGTNSAAWRFRENTPLDYNHFSNSQYPALLFSSGGDTNALLVVSITITGYVFSVVSTNATASSLPPFTTTPNQQTITNASEIVTLTTNRYVLSNRWQRVTSITTNTSLAAATGHTWSVVYDTETVLYGEQDWILTASDHNERRSFLDCLRWPVFEDAYNTNYPTQDGAMIWYGYNWASMASNNSFDFAYREDYPSAYVYTMDATNTYYTNLSGTDTNNPNGYIPVSAYWTNWNAAAFSHWPIRYIGDIDCTWEFNNYDTNSLPALTNFTVSITFGDKTTNGTVTIIRGGTASTSLSIVGGTTDGYEAIEDSGAALEIKSEYGMPDWGEQTDVVVTWDVSITDEEEYIFAGRRTSALTQATPEEWWSNVVHNVESAKQIYGLTGQPGATTAEMNGLPTPEQLWVEDAITNANMATIMLWELDSLAPQNILSPTNDVIDPVWRRVSFLENYAAGYGPQTYTNGLIPFVVPYGSGKTTRGWAITDTEWLHKCDSTTNGFRYIR